MGFNLNEMVKSKEALRRKLAERPIAEKLRIAEELSERALAIRQDSSPPPPDAPWSIPPHWRWSKMGEIATVVGGGTPPTDRADYFGGEVPWITPADLSKYTEKTISRGARNITRAGLDNSGARLLPAGTVLFSSRAPIGYVAIAANPVATNQGFKSFILRDEVKPEFVYYYLQRARELARSLASGTTFLEISGKKAAQIPVPVPPLDEQQRIVAEIEKQFTRLETGVAALQSTQAKLKRYRAAVLKAACEGRLVPTEAELARKENRSYESAEILLQRILKERREKWNGKGKLKEQVAYNNVSSAPLPEGWAWASLGQLAEFKNGINFSAAQKGQQGIPTIDVFNMYPTGIHVDLTSLYRVDLIPKEDQLLREDDILFVRSSVRREGVGYVCLFKATNEPITYCGFIIRGRINTKDLFAPYIAYFLRSRSAREQIVKGASQVTITNVNQAALGRLPVPLPPLAEQKRIVAELERRLSVVEELEMLVSANLQRAGRLRQSVLHRAFSGAI